MEQDVHVAADDPTRDALAPPLKSARTMSARLRLRRAVTLLLLTLVVPGSAQLVAGRRRVGRIAVRTWVGALATGVLLALLAVLDRRLFLNLFTRNAVLLLLTVALVALAAGWAYLFVDAWRLGRPGQLSVPGRRAVAGLAVALLVLTCGPMAYAARQVSAGRAALSGVFGGHQQSRATHGRYNVLLLGGDSGPDRVGARPDSVTLVSMDQSTARTVLLSFPRNLEDIPFPAGSLASKALGPKGFACGDTCLLNAVYTYGVSHKALFPGAADPGAEAMKEAVSAITGLKINYYVLIDLAGFRDLINAMGGITVNVTHKVPIGGGTSPVSGYIKPGRQRLDGYHALWYARSREGSSDYDRMQRQRCVMTAMLGQLDPATVLTKFQGIAAASSKVVSTDVPQADVGTFLDLALKAKSGPHLLSVQFVPPLIRPAWPDYPMIRRTIAAALQASENGADKISTAKSSTSPGTARAGASVPATPAAGSPSGATTATASSTPVDAVSTCQPG
jgi:LCP family protein required for cell wall assembly